MNEQFRSVNRKKIAEALASRNASLILPKLEGGETPSWLLGVPGATALYNINERQVYIVNANEPNGEGKLETGIVYHDYAISDDITKAFADVPRVRVKEMV